MSVTISRQQLAVLVADVARRDALINSWKPATASEWGEGAFYHEAQVRTLYPGCSIAYAGLQRVAGRERPISLYDWVVSKEGECIATHRAMVVLSSTGEPVAVVGATPRYEAPPTYDEMATPEPSPELLAALEVDPIVAQLDAAFIVVRAGAPEPPAAFSCARTAGRFGCVLVECARTAGRFLGCARTAGTRRQNDSAVVSYAFALESVARMFRLQ